MYEYLVLDNETTTFQHGNVYSQRNKLCLVGLRTPEGVNHTFDVEWSGEGYATQLEEIQQLINQTKLLVGFNIKFDCSWLRRYGIDFSHCRVFDCQLCAFILSSQQDSYPSLNGVAESFGFEQKLDEVAKLWEQGIDTPEIPLRLLTTYLCQDLYLTQKVYERQCSIISSLPKTTQRLVSLSNQDLLVLLEMEWNGIKLNFEGMQEASRKVKEQIQAIKGEIDGYFDDVPDCCRNYGSGDCLSALLYGGQITEHQRIVVGKYKTGEKTGQDRYRINSVQHVLRRRFQPPKGSALKKEGFYATNEETLRSIKGSKEERKVLDKLLEMSKLEKLDSTYYQGLQKLHEEKDWEEGYIHGAFNQCVARTGRLSSSAPNLQNLPPEMDNYTVTRF